MAKTHLGVLRPDRIGDPELDVKVVDEPRHQKDQQFAKVLFGHKLEEAQKQMRKLRNRVSHP